MTTSLVVALVGLAFVVAAWDVARRFVMQYEATTTLIQRIRTLELEQERHQQQLQAMMGKLSATVLATNGRIPRVGPR